MRIFSDKNFKRFVISYICVLVIPLAITIYAYSQATNIIERNVIESNTFRLSTFRDTLDNKISLIDRSVLELSFNDRLRRIAHMPLPDYNSPNMYWFNEFFHMFNRFAFNTMLEGDRSFLFLHHNGVVFGRNFFTSDLSDLYGRTARMGNVTGEMFRFGDMSYDEFTYHLFGNRYFSYFMPAIYVTFLGETGLYIPYIFSLPAIAGFDTLTAWGTIVYLLNASELHNLMANSLDEYGGESFILAGDRVIASTGNFQGYLDLDIDRIRGVSVDEIVWEGNSTLAIYITSEYNDLSFLTLLPLDEIHADMILLRNIVVALLLIALPIGLLISIALSYRNTLPINRLVSSNIDLQERLKDQHHSMEMLYINKLLKNDFASVKDLEIGLRHVGLEFGESGYRVIMVRILPSNLLFSDAPHNDWDVYQAFFISRISAQYKVHTLNHNELAIIAAFKPEEAVEAIIGQIQDAFNKQFGFVPLCGIGEEYHSPAEIHYSMQEAVAAADYADTLEQASHIIWYKDITSGDIFELFGKDQEQVLFNLVRQGDGDALSRHLDEIYASARYRGLSSGVKQLYLTHLHTVLMRMSVDTKIEVDFKALENQSSKERKIYFAALKEAYVQLCNQLHKSKKGRKEKLKESILAYISEQYCDSGLSVAMLAAHFNVAENYFSQFFSEQVGEPFSRYLERIRVEHACKLLADVSMSVDQVALKSGYNNTNTFRRAFKRITGTTPSDYVKV